MKLILVQRHAASRTIEFGRWSWAALSLLVLGVPLSLMAVSYDLGQRAGERIAEESRISDAELEASARAADLAQMSADAHSRLQAMTRRLAELQARVTRLDALGAHLTALAGLDGGEFDFSTEPALGGPFEAADDPSTGPVIRPDVVEQEFQLLASALDDRDTQLDVLASLMFDAEAQAQAIPAGRPVAAGWLSSRYGYRNDPFTGQKAWHQGIDFAGKTGSEILAVASGVVSWSGERAGYGTMVEVSHGDGLATRYGHNQKNLVKVGDLVRKGEPIALMGNSGRSTGPHVHFEVFKHGRAVDPSSYIRQNLR